MSRKRVLSKKELSNNPAVDHKLLRDLNEVLDQLRSLGLDTGASYRLVQPFDGRVGEEPPNGQSRAVRTENLWALRHQGRSSDQL